MGPLASLRGESSLGSEETARSTGTTSTATAINTDYVSQIQVFAFPKKLEGGLTWTGSDFQGRSISYMTELNAVDLHEVGQALESFKDHGMDGYKADAETFPLPGLEDRLYRIKMNLHDSDGTGFSVLRGMDPKQYSVEDILTVFLGISSHIGQERGLQNKRGDALSHITDDKHWGAPYAKRHGIHTNTSLPWHSDQGAHILVLQYRDVAQTGGEISLVSAWTIYNELINYPDDLEVLASPTWPIQISGNPPRYILLPLLQYHEGHIILSVDPGRLGLHPATGLGQRPDASAIPSLTEAQQRALATLSRLADKHALKLTPQAGDILFVNNLAVMHSRQAYTDDNNGARRHMVRLWLKNSELAWAVPEAMRPPFDAAFGTEANGFGKDVSKRYPVVPMPVYKVPRYTAGSAAWAIESDSEVDEN